MSEGRIKDRWVMWNLLRKGKDRSPFYGVKFAYRGPVLFSHHWPVGRLVRAPRGNFVNLARDGGWVSAERYVLLKPAVTLSLHVDDIGVLSIYEGDMLDDAALHERQRWLLNAQASELVERAQIVPERELVHVGAYYYSSGAYLAQQLESVANLYLQYKNAFELKWPKFPPTYSRELERIIATRAARYNSDPEVAKRERRQARIEAKKALGLE